ncbi:MAG: glycosyltransferase family 9 protein [Planctomycetota bacterium]
MARTVPCLTSLRNAYPEAQIDWLVGSAFVDAVRAHPALTGVVPFDRKKKSTVWPLLGRLRSAKYDLVFDLQGLLRSGFYSWGTRAATRVGYANAREFGWLGYNHRHRIDPTLHAVPRMTALLSAEGIGVANNLSLYVPTEDTAWAEAFASENQLTPGRYACVAPTAQWGCKCWPLPRYVELTRRLLERSDIDHVVVLAAPHEKPAVEAGFKELDASLHKRVVVPTTSVGQLMALIRDARLLLCNDSAPLHLAVGLDTPTVSLFGPTDPALVGPPPAEIVGAEFASKHRVLRSPSADGQTFNYRAHREDNTLIAELSSNDVWSAVDDALQP